MERLFPRVQYIDTGSQDKQEMNISSRKFITTAIYCTVTAIISITIFMTEIHEDNEMNNIKNSLNVLALLIACTYFMLLSVLSVFPAFYEGVVKIIMRVLGGIVHTVNLAIAFHFWLLLYPELEHLETFDVVVHSVPPFIILTHALIPIHGVHFSSIINSFIFVLAYLLMSTGYENMKTGDLNIDMNCNLSNGTVWMYGPALGKHTEGLFMSILIVQTFLWVLLKSCYFIIGFDSKCVLRRVLIVNTKQYTVVQHGTCDSKLYVSEQGNIRWL